MKANSQNVVLVLIGILVGVLCISCRPEAGYATSSSAAEGGEPRWIGVSGESVVRVVPDEVILTVGVETHHEDMNTAKAQNDAVIGEALRLVGDFGVESKHVQTDYINIEPRYDSYYDRKNFIGFFVRKNVAITLKDLSQFEGLLSALLDAGVTHVHGIDFRTADLRKYRDEARALAIQAAQEKAKALAAELDQGVARPLVIREERSDWFSGYASWWSGSWGSSMSQNVVQNMGGVELQADGALALGQIEIRARISVEFELVDE